MHDLLSEPIFSVRNADEVMKVSLPTVFEMLDADEVTCFPAIMAHQEHAWHAFLVQVAVMSSGSNWTERLQSLATSPTTWELVVEDLSEPAFMQPPVPEGSLEGWDSKRTPESIDLLVTAKNHDVKMHRLSRPSVEHWVFAIVSAQTMSGYPGRGNYGILRMNGGLGSRPFTAMTSSRRPGVRFKEDVDSILKAKERPTLFAEEGGIKLLWEVPWDGKAPIDVGLLDPNFVEVARRIRFDENMKLRYTTSDTKRVFSSDPLGYDDPWTPVAKEDGKPLTMPAAGFDYERTAALICNEYVPPKSMRLTTTTSMFTASVLVRGQGKTEKYHERTVLIPPKIARRVGDDGPSILGQISKSMIEDVREVGKMLASSIFRLYDPDDNGGGKHEKRPWIARDQLKGVVDDVFFDFLWRTAGEEITRSDWLVFLRTTSREILQTFCSSTSFPITRKYKSIARANHLFEGSFYNKYGAILQADSVNSRSMT